MGRPSTTPVVWYAGFLYQAKSWNQARRVVAKVEWHNGELFPRVGFIVTNLTRPAKLVVRFYNQRGTAEQWIKEGKNAVKWTRTTILPMDQNCAVRLERTFFSALFFRGPGLSARGCPASCQDDFAGAPMPERARAQP